EKTLASSARSRRSFGFTTAGRSSESSNAAHASSSRRNHRRSARICSAAVLALSRTKSVTVLLVACAARRISVSCLAVVRRFRRDSRVGEASVKGCSLGMAGSFFRRHQRTHIVCTCQQLQTALLSDRSKSSRRLRGLLARQARDV